MNQEQITYLLQQYQSGTLSSAEEQQLESGIENGWIQLKDLPDLQQLSEQLEQSWRQLPESDGRERFYQELEREQQAAREEKSVLKAPAKVRSLVSWPLRLAMGVGILLLGIGIGFGVWSGASASRTAEIAGLSQQVEEMREMMMLTLLKQRSTSERLKAVNLTREMPGKVSDRIAEALLHTLNRDPNPNVRLVTLEALIPYANDPKVRQGLIQSIPQQDSPLVQLALAELMVALQEKKSINGLKNLLQREGTPSEVKMELQHSIEVLM